MRHKKDGPSLTFSGYGESGRIIDSRTGKQFSESNVTVFGSTFQLFQVQLVFEFLNLV